jgi:hypothetical protein
MKVVNVLGDTEEVFSPVVDYADRSILQFDPVLQEDGLLWLSSVTRPMGR